MTNQDQNPNDEKESVWHLSIWISIVIGILEFGFVWGRARPRPFFVIASEAWQSPALPRLPRLTKVSLAMTRGPFTLTFYLLPSMERNVTIGEKGGAAFAAPPWNHLYLSPITSERG